MYGKQGEGCVRGVPSVLVDRSKSTQAYTGCSLSLLYKETIGHCLFDKRGEEGQSDTWGLHSLTDGNEIRILLILEDVLFVLQ